jgi:hypothetical protein
MHAKHGETRRSFDRREWDMIAAEALELARRLPPGPERSEALKAAGRLRHSADARDIAFCQARPAAKVASSDVYFFTRNASSRAWKARA